MGKLEDMHQYRTEGLSLAARVVKEAQEAGRDPLKALEDELKFRGRTKVSVLYTQREILKNNFEMQDHTVRTILAVALLALNQEFGFGKKRMMDFKDEFLRIAQSMIEGVTTGSDLLEYLDSEYGIAISLSEKNEKKKYLWEE